MMWPNANHRELVHCNAGALRTQNTLQRCVRDQKRRLKRFEKRTTVDFDAYLSGIDTHKTSHVQLSLGGGSCQ